MQSDSRRLGCSTSRSLGSIPEGVRALRVDCSGATASASQENATCIIMRQAQCSNHSGMRKGLHGLLQGQVAIAHLNAGEHGSV